MYKLIIQTAIWINNFSYRVIGFFAIKDNGGVHPKHNIIKYHNFFIENISSNEKILDVGCSIGACAHAISQKAFRVVGIDISKKDIYKAKKRFSAKNLKYIFGDATKYDFKEKFDVIILSAVLEHIDNRIDFLKKIKLLAPKILIRVPLITRSWLSMYEKEIGMEYRLDRTHKIEYTEENFSGEMEKAGLKVQNYYVKFGEIYAVVIHK